MKSWNSFEVPKKRDVDYDDDHLKRQLNLGGKNENLGNNNYSHNHLKRQLNLGGKNENLGNDWNGYESDVKTRNAVLDRQMQNAMFLPVGETAPNPQMPGKNAFAPREVTMLDDAIADRQFSHPGLALIRDARNPLSTVMGVQSVTNVAPRCVSETKSEGRTEMVNTVMQGRRPQASTTRFPSVMKMK